MNKEIGKAFGAVLRDLRNQAHLSQEKLALEADIDRSYISKLENGVYQPSLAMVFALAQILEISPKEIVGRVEEILESAE